MSWLSKGSRRIRRFEIGIHEERRIDVGGVEVRESVHTRHPYRRNVDELSSSRYVEMRQPVEKNE